MDKYTRTQIRRIRGKADSKYTATEKIIPLKGILTIFGRERRKEINEANKLRRHQATMLKELRADILYFRSYLSNIRYGSKQKLRNNLQQKDIQLTYSHQRPQKVIDYFQHDNNNKQKRLDLLKFAKKQRMELYQKLRLEKAEIQDHIESNSDRLVFRRTVQTITNRTQVFVVRGNAAAEIHSLYKSMLELLRNDGHFFDAILKVLYSDCEDQCSYVLRACEIGQLAQDELVDIKGKYGLLEIEVRIHMKEREKQVRFIRKNATELSERCRMIAHGESYMVFRAAPSNSMLATFRRGADDEPEMSKEERDLEKIMQEVKDATLASTYSDIFPRLLCQVQQEESLYKQFKRMTKLRNRLLHMKNCSEGILAALEHDLTKLQVVKEKEVKEMQKKIDAEKNRLKMEEDTTQENGEMLSTVKLALHSLYELISMMKEQTAHVTQDGSSQSLIKVIKHSNASDVEKTLPPRMEPNSRRLLVQIAEKICVLLDRSTVTLKDEPLHDAKVKRYHEVYNRRKEWIPEIDIETQEVDKHEIDDVTILSRVDVKDLSKTLVEREQRNAMLALQGRKF